MREIVPCDARAGLGRRTEGQSSLAFREAFAIEPWASHHDRSGCVGRDCGQAAITPGAVMRGQLAFAQGTVTRRAQTTRLSQPRWLRFVASLLAYEIAPGPLQNGCALFLGQKSKELG